MSGDRSGSARSVTVREEPVQLSQALKLAGVAESGGDAKQLITSELVSVNGEVETRKGRKLRAGDRVSYDGQTFVIAVRTNL